MNKETNTVWELSKCLTRLRSLRREKRRSQRETAEILGVAQRTYADYELGKIRVPVEALITLGQNYDVSLDYICGVSDERGQFPNF